ncbi:hypothetical protein [Streptomyces sp. NPDC026673]|uniref:hypothetical protein n=1 Tax=Streptomyces sp. NPDC026673 TaxID=3155724 RepID=UPI0033CA05F0
MTNAPLPSLPALEVLLEVATREREEQRAHFDSLDTKAGIILAFDGVLIPLTFNLNLASRIGTVAASLISASYALAAYWPRKFPVLEVDQLRRYLTYDETTARLVLHDTTLMMVKEARTLLAAKGRNLKRSLAALFVAALMLGIGAILTPSSGGKSDEPKPKPPGESASPASGNPGTHDSAPTPTFSRRP